MVVEVCNAEYGSSDDVLSVLAVGHQSKKSPWVDNGRSLMLETSDYQRIAKRHSQPRVVMPDVGYVNDLLVHSGTIVRKYPAIST